MIPDNEVGCDKNHGFREVQCGATSTSSGVRYLFRGRHEKVSRLCFSIIYFHRKKHKDQI